MLSEHNPHFKLIGKTVKLDGGKHVQLVYCISNEGLEEGLEAYYYEDDKKIKGHYKSYRWFDNEIPKKYQEIYEELRNHISEVPDGHKLDLNLK